MHGVVDTTQTVMNINSKPGVMQLRFGTSPCVGHVKLQPRLSFQSRKQQHAQHEIATRAVPSAHASGKKSSSADVVIIGAGIIGLLTAHALLQDRLSVALVERQELCAGATGAGQGYIWMSHRSPDAPTWELATASTRMWRNFVQADPSLGQGVEWQDTGSLLLASSAAEVAMLTERATMLEWHGMPVQLLSRDDVMKLEPAVRLPEAGAGLLAPKDAQINGRLTAALLLKRCQAFGSAFQSLMHEPVEHLEMDHGTSRSQAGHIVHTQHHCITANMATVVAAGVWTGQLLAQATQQLAWQNAFLPRRGHLLKLERPASMPEIKTGMMEVSYTKHYASSTGAATHNEDDAGAVDITFTATSSANGSLLLGSSRELRKLEKAADPQIVAAIMQRAAQFLPGLQGCTQPSGDAVRVGPRPYAVGGLPFVGPVPRAPGLFCAAGHEGSGLCQGPATAELLCQYIRQGHEASQQEADVPNGLCIDEPWCKALLPEQRLADVPAH